jgi:hypothetical protein
MERLYLGAQLRKFENDSRSTLLAEQFLKVTSRAASETTDEAASEDDVMSFMKELFRLISTSAPRVTHGYPTSNPETNMIRLKLVHNMLRFMEKYQLQRVSDPTRAIIRSLVDSKTLQDFDEAMMLCSDVFKTVYMKYGEVLQRLPGGLTSRVELKHEVKDLIFLTDMNQKNQPSIFSATYNADSYFDHPQPGQFIGINHPWYRLAHLLESYQGIRIKPISELAVPSFTHMIHRILVRLTNMQMNTHIALNTQFDQLRLILKRPFDTLI